MLFHFPFAILYALYILVFSYSLTFSFMSETSFSLKFTRDISACNLDNLVFESEEIDKLDFLNSVALPDNILSELAIHRNKAEKESFCISTYHPLFGAKKLHIFSVHSKTDSTKELVKILQEIDGDIAFYTSKKDAILPIMDALILGSYQFDQFLTKKHQKKMMLISPELHTDFLPIVEDRRQLLSSIYLVRDMVNMPPSQKYPKKLVEQIQSLPFHNTKVTVIDKKELEEK